MPIIVGSKVEKYLAGLRGPRDSFLTAMEKIAARRNFPIVGPDTGMFFYVLAKIIGARKILELGSGYGYSAFWFANALPAGGVVHCTDLDPENEKLARQFFEQAGWSSKLRFHLGEALQIADTLKGGFDIVLNDIDKEDYPKVIDKALRLLRPGGLLLTDNALWYGKVAEKNQDPATRAIVKFNKIMARHPQFETLVVPQRDGLSIAIRK